MLYDRKGGIEPTEAGKEVIVVFMSVNCVRRTRKRYEEQRYVKHQITIV